MPDYRLPDYQITDYRIAGLLDYRITGLPDYQILSDYQIKKKKKPNLNTEQNTDITSIYEQQNINKDSVIIPNTCNRIQQQI